MPSVLMAAWMKHHAGTFRISTSFLLNDLLCFNLFCVLTLCLCRVYKVGSAEAKGKPVGQSSSKSWELHVKYRCFDMSQLKSAVQGANIGSVLFAYCYHSFVRLFDTSGICFSHDDMSKACGHVYILCFSKNNFLYSLCCAERCQLACLQTFILFMCLYTLTS